MKKLLVIVMAVLMIVSAACTAAPAEEADATPENVATTPNEEVGVTEASKGTIKIGFLGALSGNAAALGQDARDAFELYLKQRGNKLAGYDIEYYIEDDEDNADTTLTKCTKLVEQYGCDVIIGPQNAGGAAAIADYLVANETPLLLYAAALDSLTKAGACDYFARVSLCASQASHVAADFALNECGAKKAAIFTYDFAFGYGMAGGFQRVFEDGGGKVISKQYTTIGTTDFAPFLANIDWDEIDILAYHFSGGDGSRFCQALVDAGITEREDISVICMNNGLDELYVSDLPTQLADIPFYSVLQWAVPIENETNKEFVEMYNQEFGRNPTAHAENTWTCMTVLESALEITGAGDGAALVNTIRSLTDIPAPRGVIKGFDEYGQIISDVTVRGVEVKDGKLANTVVKTYKDVSQFWTYSPEEFMTMPEYSKDYPPLS